MSGERELDALGVTAVDQATIEARVLAQAQQAGAAPTEAPTDAADPSSLLQQLAAVRREARTVAAAVERFQQQAEEREQQAEQGDADGGGQVQEDGQAPGPPAAAPGGALQQALMQQRLAGLHAQQQQLETALQELGVVSAGAAAAGGASAEPAAAAATAGGRSRAPMRGKRQAAAPLPLTGPAAGSDKRKGKKQVQFDLAEADIFEGADAAGGAAAAAAAGGLVETERDRLIRLGILTPFDRLDGFERRIERGPRGRAGSAAGQQAQREQQGGRAAAAAAGLEGHESIRRLGEKMRAAQAARPTTMLVDASELPRPERPTRRIDEGFWRQSSSGRSALPSKKKRKRTLAPAKRHRLAPGMRHHRGGGGSGSEGEEEWSGSEGGSASAEEEEAAGSGEDLAGEFDDADAAVFEERRASYLRRQSRKAARRRRLRKAGGGGDGQQREQQAADAGGQPGELEDDVEADGLAGAAAAQPRGGGPPAGSDLRSGRERQGCSGLESDLESDLGSEEEEEEEEDVVFEGGYRLPADVWNRLFDYQRTAVKWMWELHTQRAGGIIGDEMGLGKTIQVIAFLAGLHHSGLFRPSLIVCPATVLRQWLRELRAWWPLFRVALLHDSARSGSGAGTRPSRSRLIQEIARSDCGILLTTYETMRLQRGELVGVDWGYVVLDEGHKIRNPDAEVTLAAKQMQTVHRIVMSGSPIQNRLAELWSLFDFVFPGKLGTLPVFTAQFALPIQIGGYANANPLQVSTAYKCAVILRDLIAPYLLRRRKVDVRAQLPQKTEQVLFCTLTGEQRTLYKGYLSSKELQEIFAGSRTALAGIDILRKICNHPDLLERAKWEAAEDYGNPERSGKMQVLAKVLRHWREQGHKALVFTQTQQMLDIVEKHAQAQGYTYHRMDGSTSVATRARLIDDFNNNPEVFCFLLTTRVGGLGVNLTGANRVLLYDPDWNPSTDVQARERAWRIGQTREVVIYRLITSGTIEEKVYHRQVYKHFLTDKVLRDPRQRRFFKAKDLTDLFTLGDEYADGTETASLFATLGTDVLPDEEQPEAEAAEGEGEERHASDQDDYSSGPEPSPQQAQQRQRRPSSRSSSRSRRSGSAERGGSADLPAGAGVRSEAVAQEEEGADAASGSGKGDAKILRELFEGSDVRGAIDHTKVEGANDPQRRAAEQEAARIAKRAAEALRQSRLACQQAPVNQPTWTGRSGGAGLPGGGSGQPRFGRAANPRLGPAAQAEQAAAAAVAAGGGGGGSGTTARRFGSGATGARPPLAGAGAGAANGVAPRSSEIIARLRERQAAVASAAAAAAAADPAVEQAQLLAAQIASFLEARGGAAASDELVQHFQATVGAAQLPVFRGVLKQVAALQRQPGGGKQWVLRHEYAGGGQGGQR